MTVFPSFGVRGDRPLRTVIELSAQRQSPARADIDIVLTACGIRV